MTTTLSRSPGSATLPTTLEWIGDEDGFLRLLDQTRLPGEVVAIDCRKVEQIWDAIKVLAVRGAPAIGVSAAYGLCVGLQPHRDIQRDQFLSKANEVGEYLKGCRPTAVNLAWAVDRMLGVLEDCEAGDGKALWQRLFDEARDIHEEDIACCRAIGEHGARLIPEGGGVLTHCNAGALATSAYGTALSLMYVAHEQGMKFKVYADETRPLLQGARLTAFELSAAGIDVSVICDGVGASLMRRGEIQLVVTGADRIAANGDAANKIGTYAIAVAAKHHGIPFYVAAPRSTFDASLSSGDLIPIEERSETEVREGFGRNTVAPLAGVRNPAFDVTPAELITGFVTEKGVLEPVTNGNLTGFLGSGG